MIDPSFGLDDKGVIVTGAAGGIGRATALLFEATGARVCAVDIDEEGVQKLVESFAEPSRHLAVGFDLRETSQHESLIHRAQKEFGGLHVLAHLAAVLRRAHDVTVVSEEDWDAQLDVNLKAAFFLDRAAAEVMKEQGEGGRIINFSSQSWWSGGFGGAVVYSASKGGIVSMCRGLARTYGPHNILVNTVAPGLTDTPMLREGMTEQALQELLSACPLGRMADPMEIAAVVVFLASRHASYVSGATINVSGGFLMY